MKKVLTAAVLSVLLGLSAHADFIRVEAGGGIWSNELSGTVQYDGATAFDASSLGYSDESKAYLWMFIKHPIPIVPNLRLEYAKIDYSGTATDSFEWGGNTYTADSTSATELSQIDAILYYNILDNTAWITVDLGLDIKYIDASIKGASVGNTQSFDESDEIMLPLAYGRARFEIPMTDIGIEGEAKYVAYQDSSMLDYSVKVDYTLVNILPIDVGLEVGYRFQKLDLDSGDIGGLDSSLDIEIDGLFAGAVLRF